MEEQSSYIEQYIKKFAEKKSRIAVLICSAVSVICSLLFMTENILNASTTLYTILTLLTGAAGIIYVTDIKDKNRHRNDILIGGIALHLAGILLRIIRTGLSFSVRFFIGYCFFGAAVILLAAKLSKDKGKEKNIIFFFSAAALYCIFEFFYANTYYISSFTSAMYRIAEASLFIGYIGILLMNKNNFREFSDNVGNYKAQVPSLKTCFGIYVLFIALITSIGTVKNLDKIQNKTTIVHRNVTAQKSHTKEKTEEKSEKIEKNEKITSAKDDTKPISAEAAVQVISAGEKITTDKFDFTLNKVEITYEIKPENTSGVYSCYTAENGKVYVHIDGNYYNKSAKDVYIRDLFTPTAEYDNGYNYNGFVAVDDDNRFDWVSSYIACTPLETCHYHGIIECPEVVGNTEVALKVKFKIDGIVYEYVVR